MANEFKIKKGLIVTGANGGTVVDIQGSQGQLFSVTDDLSGSIFAVSDISGVPILDVNSSGLSTFDGDVNLPDNNKLLLGTGNDLQIYHDGSNSYIDNNTGDLTIDSGVHLLARTAAGESLANFYANGANELFYDNSKKLETTSTGVTVTGDINQGAMYYQDGGGAGRIGFNRNPTNGVIHDANYNAFQFNGASASGVNGKFEIQSYNQSGVFGGSITISKTSDLTTSSQVFSAATSSGDASSTLTTKGYVDGLITGATIYRGAWQAGISATSSAATTASTTLTVTAAILDADGNTPVLVGAVVTGEGITGIVKVASVTSSTVYVLDTAITATATAYIFSPIYGAPDLSGVTETSGYYYICSEAGSATPNGADSEPNTWNVGDWCIYNDVSGTGQWQKIDNSSVLSGAGTGQTVALWEGPSSVTDSETLGNAPITVSGSDTTFEGTTTVQGTGDSSFAGNVGIGTTSPSAKLEVKSSANLNSFVNINTTTDAYDSGISLRQSSNYGFDVYYTDDGVSPSVRGLYFDRVNNGSVANAMFIDRSNGNVGIGTVSPNAKLHVNNGGSGNIASFASGATAVNNYAGITLHTQTNSGNDWYGSEIRSINTASTPGSLNPRLGFFTQDNNTYLPANRTEKMSILGNGNVGIGTTSPSAKLDIHYFTSGGNDDLLNIGLDATNPTRAKIYTENYDGNFGLWDSGSAQQVKVSSDGNSYLNGGNVGIGTTSPGAKLVISGGGGAISDNGFQINSGYGYSGTGVLEINPSAASHIPLSILSKNGQTANLVNVTSFSGTAGNLFNVQSSGNVGIGETSPLVKLQIRGSEMPGTTDPASVEDMLTLYRFGSPTVWAGGASLALGRYSTGGSSYPKSRLDFKLKDAQGSNTALPETTVMTMQSNGNIGIGTTGPRDTLEIVGNMRFVDGEDHLMIKPNNAIHGADFIVGDGVATTDTPVMSLNGLYGGQVTIQTQGNTIANKTVLDVQGTQGQLFSVTDDLSGSIFAVADISGVPIFDVNSSGVSYFDGNVGIGTASPTSKLHVFGGSANTELKVTTNDNYIARLGLYEEKPGNLHGGFIQYRGESGDRLEIGSRNAGTDTVHMSIDDITGNVGIGTDSPQSKLHIETGSGGTYNPNVNHDDVTIEGSGNIGLQLFSPATSYQYIAFGDPNSVNAGYLRYYHGTNEMVFRTNGSDNMVINSNGNVGIGTTSPSTPLHINADAPTLRLQDATSGDNHYLAGNNGELRVQSSGFITMRPGATASTTFLANGNVGIGTTSPSEKLGVFGNIRLENGAQRNIIGPTNENLGIFANPNGSDEGILFSTDNGVTTEMIILNGGNVGIGTTSPSTKLEIEGDATGDDTAQLIIASGGADNNSIIHFTDDAGGQVNAIGALEGNILTLASQNELVFKTGTSSILGNTDTRMTIDTTGNVGIGTTSPTEISSGATTLEISGTVTTKSGALRLASSDNSLSSYFYHQSSGLLMGTATAQPIRIITNNSEKIRIESGGNVGIGLTNPGSKLDVDGKGSFGDATTYALKLKSSGGARGINILSNDGTSRGGIDWSTADFIIRNSSDDELLKLNYSSKNATLVGNVTATNFILSSDKRLKENIEKVCDNRVKVDWKTFELKTEKGQKRYGVIAQELEENHPEFVKTDDEGFKSVKYIDLLIAKIAELEARLEKLEK